MFFSGVTGIELEKKLNSKSTEKSGSNYFSYYEGIDDQLLRDIYDLYKYDFKLFGYEVPQFLQKVINDTL